MHKDYLNIIPFDLLCPPVNNGFSMKGQIRTKEKCQSCKGSYTELPRGIVCTKCGTTPKKLFIDLGRYKGDRIRIYSDDTGAVLDSFARAHRVLESIRYKIDRKTFDPKDYIKRRANTFWFEERLNDWITIKEKEVSSGTIAPSYIREIKRYSHNYYLNFFSPTEDVREINTPKVRLFYRSLPDSISSKTKKNIIDTLRAFMNFLRKEGWIKEAPEFPRIEVPEASWSWVDVEMQEKILSGMREKFKSIFFFMMRHGIRPGEACALKWKDVDFDKGIVIIRRTFSLGHLREVTKTKRIRFLPLHSETLEWMKKQENRFPESFVFPRNVKGEPLYNRALRKEWKRITEPLGLNIRLYDGTRHSFASQAVNSGIPLNLIQDALGHTSSNTTRRYAHTDIESLRKIIEPPDKVVSIKRKRKKKEVDEK